jgi:serine/threonine protein kinase
MLVPPQRAVRATQAPHARDAESTPLGLEAEAAYDRAFGRLVVEREFVTEQQVRESLDAQKLMARVGVKKPIDEVMIDKGLITRYQARRLAMLVKEGGRVTEIGGFRITGKLGKGGMGTVYRARQISLDRDVALKILPRHLAEDESYVDRFLREARSAARLNHPNIVQAIDAGEDRGFYYFAMELVEGEAVKSILKRIGRLQIGQACRIAVDVARALQYAWREQHMIHRDVKPDNILISKHGVAKLADLGLAKSAHADSELTVSGFVIGTPHYISPEQVEGDPELDPRSDVYALGCTLFHMLTGRVPFRAESPAAVFVKHVTQAPPDPREFNPEVPPELARIVLKMIEKRPESRFQGMGKVAAALEAFLAGTATEVDTAGLVSPSPEDFSGQATVLVPGTPPPAASQESGDSLPPPLPREAAPPPTDSAFRRISPTETWLHRRRVGARRRRIALGAGTAVLVAALAALTLWLVLYGRRPERRAGPPRVPRTFRPEPSPPGPATPEPPTPPSRPEAAIPALFDEQAVPMAAFELNVPRQAAALLLGGRLSWFSDGTMELLYDFTTLRQYEDFGLTLDELPPGGGLRLAAGTRLRLTGREPEAGSVEPPLLDPTRPFSLTVRALGSPTGLVVRFRAGQAGAFQAQVDAGEITAGYNLDEGGRQISHSREIGLPSAGELLLHLAGDGKGRLWVGANSRVVELEGAFEEPLSLELSAEGADSANPRVLTNLTLRATPAEPWLGDAARVMAERLTAEAASRAGERKKHLVLRKDGSADAASLAEALASVAPGGTIEIADTGPYRIERPLEIAAQIHIRAAPGVTPLVVLSAEGGPALRFTHSCVLNGLLFHVAGLPRGENPAVGLAFEKARFARIEGCAFLAGANAVPVRIAGRTGRALINDTVFVAWPFGPALPEAAAVVTDGWAGTSLTLQHCLFWGLARHGAAVTHFNQARPSPVNLYNSIVAVDQDVAFGRVGRWIGNAYLPGTSVAAELVPPEGAPRLERPGRANILAEPAFTAPFDFDFRLLPDSPCRAAPGRGRDIGPSWPEKRVKAVQEIAGLLDYRAGDALPLSRTEEINLLAPERRKEWAAVRGRIVTAINGVEAGDDPRIEWRRAVEDFDLHIEWSNTAPGTLALCAPAGQPANAPRIVIGAGGEARAGVGGRIEALPERWDFDAVHVLEARVRGPVVTWTLDGRALPEGRARRSAADVPVMLQFSGRVLLKRATVRIPPPAPAVEINPEESGPKGPGPVTVDVRPGGAEIFNGKDLEGWKIFGGNWRVEKGVIVGSGEKESGGYYLLLYGRSFLPNAHVRLWYDYHADEATSGDLYYRGLVISLARLHEGKLVLMPVSKFSYLSPEIARKGAAGQELIQLDARFPEKRWYPVLLDAEGDHVKLYVAGREVLSRRIESASDTNVGFFYSTYSAAVIRNVRLADEKPVRSSPVKPETE